MVVRPSVLQVLGPRDALDALCGQCRDLIPLHAVDELGVEHGCGLDRVPDRLLLVFGHGVPCVLVEHDGDAAAARERVGVLVLDDLVPLARQCANAAPVETLDDALLERWVDLGELQRCGRCAVCVQERLVDGCSAQVHAVQVGHVADRVYRPQPRAPAARDGADVLDAERCVDVFQRVVQAALNARRVVVRYAGVVGRDVFAEAKFGVVGVVCAHCRDGVVHAVARRSELLQRVGDLRAADAVDGDGAVGDLGDLFDEECCRPGDVQHLREGVDQVDDDRLVLLLHHRRLCWRWCGRGRDGRGRRFRLVVAARARKEAESGDQCDRE